MLKRLSEILFYTDEPYDPGSLGRLRDRRNGGILLGLFIISIVLYKTVFPHEYLFLFSWVMSVFGVPIFFIAQMDIFFTKRGWELSHGRYDAGSLSKFFNLILGGLFIVFGIFLPIIIKLNI